jgi:hypothetical protein
MSDTELTEILSSTYNTMQQLGINIICKPTAL